MKLPCAVVRDLLPLYAEKMTETETQALVGEHLRDCPACRKLYEGMEAGEAAPVDTAAPLRTLKREIRRRRLRAAGMAALAVFVALLTWFYHADSLKPVRWQEGLVRVVGVRALTEEDMALRAADPAGKKQLEPGREALFLRTDSRISGTRTQVVEEEDGSMTAVIQGFGRQASLGEKVSRQEGEMMICPVPDRLIYGFGEGQSLLWGAAEGSGVQVLPRLALNGYALVCAALSVLLGGVWLIFRRKAWGGAVRQAFFVPAAWLLAHLLVKGVRGESFFLARDLVFVALMACALYGLLTLACCHFLENKSAR